MCFFSPIYKVPQLVTDIRHAEQIKCFKYLVISKETAHIKYMAQKKGGGNSNIKIQWKAGKELYQLSNFLQQTNYTIILWGAVGTSFQWWPPWKCPIFKCFKSPKYVLNVALSQEVRLPKTDNNVWSIILRAWLRLILTPLGVLLVILSLHGRRAPDVICISMLLHLNIYYLHNQKRLERGSNRWAET